MSLDDRFRAAATAIRSGDADPLLLEQAYQVADVRELNADAELTGALERAYRAASDAEAQGNLLDAATYFRVAADQGIGDACVRLVPILARLGELDEAREWCAVAAREGFDVRLPEAVVAPVRAPDLPVASGTARQRFLEHAAAVTVGADMMGDWLDSGPWLLRRVDEGDIRRIEAATAAFRTLDHRYGGLACRGLVLDQLKSVEPLLRGRYDDAVRDRLYSAVADLHNLAGWVSFDSGLIDAAHSHFAQALTLAKNDYALMADVLARAGRMYLHHNSPDDALRAFQLGLLAARNAGTADVARLSRLASSAHRELGDNASAVRQLETVVDNYPEERVRARTIALATLATGHFRGGDTATATALGDRALDASAKLRSQRASDHLTLLRAEAGHHSGTGALVDRITTRLRRPG